MDTFSDVDTWQGPTEHSRHPTARQRTGWLRNNHSQSTQTWSGHSFQEGMLGHTSGYISRSLCDSFQFFLVPFQLSLLTMSRGGGRIPTGDFWHAWLRRIAIMRSAGLPPMKSHIDLSWDNAKEQRVVCQRVVAGRGWHLRHAGISRCEHAVLGAKGCTQNQTKTRTCVVMTHINLSIFQVTSL